MWVVTTTTFLGPHIFDQNKTQKFIFARGHPIGVPLLFFFSLSTTRNAPEKKAHVSSYKLLYLTVSGVHMQRCIYQTILAYEKRFNLYSSGQPQLTVSVIFCSSHGCALVISIYLYVSNFVYIYILLAKDLVKPSYDCSYNS